MKFQYYEVSNLDKYFSESLDKEITEKEILLFKKNVKNIKSPGSDRYTVEFFKFLKVDLKNYIDLNNMYFLQESTSYRSTFRDSFMSNKRE